MTYQQTLEDLSLGELSAEEGLKVIRTVMQDGSQSGSHHHVYEALRNWLWKALWTRRTDDGLKQWISLFDFAALSFEQETPAISQKVEVLTELLRASIRKGEAERNEDPLTRKHVAEMLELIAENGGQASRSYMRAVLDIKPANLTRVMGPLVDRGYVEVERKGREIAYRITRKGHSLIPKVEDSVSREKPEPSYVAPEIRVVEAIEEKSQKHVYLRGIDSSSLAGIQFLDTGHRKDHFSTSMRFVGPFSSPSATAKEKDLA